MIMGGILEVVVALAGVGTAVVLYPVVKRQNEAAALGFVGSRTWRPPPSLLASSACSRW